PDAEEERQDQDVDVIDEASKRKNGQVERENHLAGLRPDEDRALRHSVSDRSSERGEQKHRQELQRSDEAERERRTGENQDQPALGQALHPGADERNGLSGVKD